MSCQLKKIVTLNITTRKSNITTRESPLRTENQKANPLRRCNRFLLDSPRLRSRNKKSTIKDTEKRLRALRAIRSAAGRNAQRLFMR